jgi:hypothetical protein
MPRFSSYLLGFRDSYCARSVLLDHLSSDGFDYLSELFDLPRSYRAERLLKSCTYFSGSSWAPAIDEPFAGYACLLANSTLYCSSTSATLLRIVALPSMTNSFAGEI